MIGEYVVPEWVNAQALDKLVPREQLLVIVSRPSLLSPVFAASVLFLLLSPLLFLVASASLPKSCLSVILALLFLIPFSLPHAVSSVLLGPTSGCPFPCPPLSWPRPLLHGYFAPTKSRSLASPRCLPLCRSSSSFSSWSCRFRRSSHTAAHTSPQH